MPKGKRLPDELALQAVELYAQGVQIPKIAQKLKIKSKTIQNWKRRNWPEPWEKKRKGRLEKAAQILEEESLDTLLKSSIKQQRAAQAIANRLARRIVQAADSDIPVPTAIRGFNKVSQYERELYLDPMEVLKVKHSARVNLSANALGSIQSDEQNAMQFLEGSFTEIHAADDNTTDEAEQADLPATAGTRKARK